MIIVDALKTKRTVIKICTACYLQEPIRVHKVLQADYAAKCDICSRIDKVWTIVHYQTSGVAHQILSDIGFYRAVLIDRHKEK